MEISEVENAIKCLDINKTYGMVCVYAEHLKYCDKRIVPLLAVCITVFLYMDFYLVLCYLLCWFLLSKINVARLTAKTIIDLFVLLH